MSKLKVGIIGAGGIAHAHLPRLSERSDAVTLAAIADVNTEAAAAVAKQYGIEASFGDYHEIFPLVDAVVICVPTFLHTEIAVAALNAGKAVFCEKPMARTLEDAEAMQAASVASGAPLQIGFVRRFDADWHAWREAILSEKIGRPVVWRDVHGHPGPSNAAWFYDDARGGGPFLDGCIHNYDFGLYTFGPVEWVFCHGRTLRSTSTAIDTGTATLHFQSGDELLVAWSWGLPQGTYGTGVFEFFGPKGVVQRKPAAEPDDTMQNYVAHYSATDEELFPYPSNALGAAFEAQMDEFIEVAQGNAQPRAGAAEGIASLRVGLAVLESGRTGQVVRL